ncbi:BsuBI/PstI family type II restriction endonuclease [Enterobacter cloacae complex sp. 339J8]|uniref:BsuBI/PstI family type II restriction endonuclease n=1 Tax=Enterobacter cloacae complex sp. 339J8 TaxID=3395869 RepID=UPI003CF26CB1
MVVSVREKVGIDLASRLKLKIDPSKTLPDVISVDLGTKTDGSDMLFVFNPIVASDGAINSMRKQKLTEIAIEAGFSAQNLAFVTAFQDCSAAPFKKAMSELAWGTYAWFCSEPDNLIELRDGSSIILSRAFMIFNTEQYNTSILSSYSNIILNLFNIIRNVIIVEINNE